MDVSAFIVQESIHADWVSRHETREEAIAAIEEMIREGLAESGEFNIREIDDRGETVRVFGVPDATAPDKTGVAGSSVDRGDQAEMGTSTARSSSAKARQGFGQAS